MVAKAVKAVAIKWLKSNLFDRLPAKALTDYPVLKTTLAHLQDMDDKAITLSVRGLESDEVMKILEDSAKNCEVVILDEINYVVEGSPQNEAYARCILNNILVCCMAEEKRLVGSIAAKTFPPEASADPDTIGRPATPIKKPAELNLRFETNLQYSVSYKDEKRTLNGVADYSLWYEDNYDMGTNLIIVQAKRLESFKTALVRAVCYMGIVHARRLDSGKRNTVVYGICSDGESFKFCRIDNDGVLSYSATYEWEFEGHRSTITSYMRHIIRAAIASSPSTSPTKGRELEVRLQQFTDIEKKKLFDFGIGDLAIEDDDEEEMEVVDAPDIA